MKVARVHAIEEAVGVYFAAWNETDAAKRKVLLAPVWAEAGVYADPTVETVGIDALSDHIDGVLARLPGSRIVLVGGIEVHHHYARFRWSRVDAGGRSLRDGVDFAEVDDAGRFTRMIGFFEAAA